MGWEGAVLLKVWGCVMLHLLMLGRSLTICKRIQPKAPNLAPYEAHFPNIIPDLRLFVEEERRNHTLMGVCGTNGTHVIKHRARHVSQEKHKTARKTAKAGLYVLDLLSRWDQPVEVWSSQINEINVLLQPSQAWTQVLTQYETTTVTMTAALHYEIRKSPLIRKFTIETEPFARYTYGNSRMLELLKQLPCSIFRLSRWVFDAKLGALAMIYVQVAEANTNMLARLALIHAPKHVFHRQRGRKLHRYHFIWWIYQHPSHTQPVAAGNINIEQLVAAMKSLAESHHDKVSLNAQLPSPKHAHPYSLPLDKHHNSCKEPSHKDHSSCNQHYMEKDDTKHEVPQWNHDEWVSMLNAAAILESLKGHNEKGLP